MRGSVQVAAHFGAAVGVAVVGVLVHAGAAGASCAGPRTATEDLPVLFEGHMIERLASEDRADEAPSPNFRWVVDTPINGVQAGDTVDIVMSVPQRDGNMVAASSIDIGPAPEPGIRYLVGAYRGTGSASERLFTNACGGTLEPLERTARPDDRVEAADTPSREPSASQSDSLGVAVWLAAVAVFALAASGAWAIRSRFHERSP